MATPILLPEVIEDTGIGGSGDYCIVLFNDDVTPIELVVFALCSALEIDADRAALFASDVHCMGQATVYYSPNSDDCEQRAQMIATMTRIPGTNGVRVEVQREC